MNSASLASTHGGDRNKVGDMLSPSHQQVDSIDNNCTNEQCACNWKPEKHTEAEQVQQAQSERNLDP
jgi:hypothetical protein